MVFSRGGHTWFPQLSENLSGAAVLLFCLKKVKEEEGGPQSEVVLLPPPPAWCPGAFAPLISPGMPLQLSPDILTIIIFASTSLTTFFSLLTNYMYVSRLFLE